MQGATFTAWQSTGTLTVWSLQRLVLAPPTTCTQSTTCSAPRPAPAGARWTEAWSWAAGRGRNSTPTTSSRWAAPPPSTCSGRSRWSSLEVRRAAAQVRRSALLHSGRQKPPAGLQSELELVFSFFTFTPGKLDAFHSFPSSSRPVQNQEEPGSRGRPVLWRLNKRI